MKWSRLDTIPPTAVYDLEKLPVHKIKPACYSRHLLRTIFEIEILSDRLSQEYHFFHIRDIVGFEAAEIQTGRYIDALVRFAIPENFMVSCR